jgi:hypothetical protein
MSRIGAYERPRHPVLFYSRRGAQPRSARRQVQPGGYSCCSCHRATITPLGSLNGLRRSLISDGTLQFAKVGFQFVANHPLYRREQSKSRLAGSCGDANLRTNRS